MDAPATSNESSVFAQISRPSDGKMEYLIKFSGLLSTFQSIREHSYISVALPAVFGPMNECFATSVSWM